MLWAQSENTLCTIHNTFTKNCLFLENFENIISKYFTCKHGVPFVKAKE